MGGPGGLGACGLMRIARLGLIIACGAVASHPSLARGQTTLVGSVHGVAVADVPSALGSGNIPLPNAQVTVTDATSSTPGGESFTTLGGFFSTPLQPAGRYRVCAKATGITEGCSQASRSPPTALR